MLSFGFRIFCWYRGFCHRTGSDLLLFLSMCMSQKRSPERSSQKHELYGTKKLYENFQR